MCVSIKLFKLLIEWLTCGCMGTWGQGFCSLLPVGILYNLGIREESCISRIVRGPVGKKTNFTEEKV